MVQLGTTNEDDKPRFSSLPPGRNMQTLTLEEAIGLFELPKTVGEYEDKNVIVSVGRFGPYIQHAGKFTSIPKGIDPLSVDLHRAIELIETKREAEAKSLLKTFEGRDDLQIRNGRFGPYIKYEGENYKLPKNTDIELLSEAECVQIIAQEKEKKKGKKRASRSSATATSKKALDQKATTTTNKRKATKSKKKA